MHIQVYSRSRDIHNRVYADQLVTGSDLCMYACVYACMYVCTGSPHMHLLRPRICYMSICTCVYVNTCTLERMFVHKYACNFRLESRYIMHSMYICDVCMHGYTYVCMCHTPAERDIMHSMYICDVCMHVYTCICMQLSPGKSIYNALHVYM